MKRIGVFLLVSLLFAACLWSISTEAHAADPLSGRCGDDMTWILDAETGVLTISGTGYMDNVSSMIYSPWFDLKDQIKSVVIESGVKSIGAFMLSGLPKMTSVQIPDTVAVVYNAAFELSTGLEEVILPDSVQRIERSAFHRCTGLTKVVLPKAADYEAQVFAECTSLTRVTVPAGSKGGGSMFANCTALTKVTLENGLKSLPPNMFSGCTALTDITIPGSVTAATESPFLDCTALTKVTFEEGIQQIGPYCFQGCTALKRVTFPASITALDEGVFQYCSNLEAIYFTGNLPKIDRVALSTVIATAYYPPGNKTWTQDALAYYGATTLYWEPGPHEHAYSSKVTAPSCTKEGFTTHTCSICGDTKTDTKVKALGHSFTTYVSDGNATTEADGTKTAQCSRTGCTATDTVTDAGTKLPPVGSDDPDGGTDAPDGGTDAPDGGTDAPGGSTETPDGGTDAPDGGTETPDGGANDPADDTDGSDSLLIPALCIFVGLCCIGAGWMLLRRRGKK